MPESRPPAWRLALRACGIGGLDRNCSTWVTSPAWQNSAMDSPTARKNKKPTELRSFVTRGTCAPTVQQDQDRILPQGPSKVVVLLVLSISKADLNAAYSVVSNA